MNNNTPACQLRPVLIDGAQGALIGFYHPPAEGVARRGDAMVVPAFAEEMNRCRSMVTFQAQALAALGIGTLVLDMHGTGCSAGEFNEGAWEGWRDDMRLGIAWLRQHGNGCRLLLGVRLGALMAAELAADDPAIDQLLLWVPVVAGKAYWTQFLRIRIAADMALPNGVKSTEELRRQSAEGQVVEASGYLVGPALAQQLDRLAMPDAARLQGKQVAWLEVVANAEASVPRANAKQAEDWRAKGVAIQQQQVVGPAFWQVHERDVAPDLITASTAAVAAWPGGALPVPTVLAPALRLGQPAQALEYPVAFRCGDDELSGVVHRGAPGASLGVVIVVAGGPQFRAGAHRQFVSLARLFASHGYPVLRFDLRGMGDASGNHVGYQQSKPDIRAAVDEFMRREPALQQVALFGECNSASGILFYAPHDPRVRQIALANPWVRTNEVQAEVILKHYYLDRLKSPEFWRHVLGGKFQAGAAVRSFVDVVTTYARGKQALRRSGAAQVSDNFDHLPLPSRTAEGLKRFRGRVLFLMSGRDYIAREFDEVTKSHPAWAGLLDDPRVSRQEIADADHTFSKPEAKAEAQAILLAWLAGASAGVELGAKRAA